MDAVEMREPPPKKKKRRRRRRRRGEPSPPQRPTVKARAMELLATVVGHEDRITGLPVPEGHPDARSVGLPYDEVLATIRREFPGCGTSRECLRWYVSAATSGDPRHAGHVLPGRRPRSREGRPCGSPPSGRGLREALEASLVELERAARSGDRDRVERARERVRRVRALLGE